MLAAFDGTQQLAHADGHGLSQRRRTFVVAVEEHDALRRPNFVDLRAVRGDEARHGSSILPPAPNNMPSQLKGAIIKNSSINLISPTPRRVGMARLLEGSRLLVERLTCRCARKTVEQGVCSPALVDYGQVG